VSPTTPDRISVVIGGTTIDSDSSTVALSKANRKEARGIAKPKEKEARGNSKPNSRKRIATSTASISLKSKGATAQPKAKKTLTTSTALKSSKSKASSKGAMKEAPHSTSSSPTRKRVSKEATKKVPHLTSSSPSRKRVVATEASSMKVRKGVATESPHSMDREESANVDIPLAMAEESAIRNIADIPGYNGPMTESLANNDECCYICGKTPCKWLEYGVDVLSAVRNCFDVSTAETAGYVVEQGSGNEVSNNRVQFKMYRMFTYEKFGGLGKGNQMKLPNCVESAIKRTFPDLDGNYTNFNPNNEVSL